VAGLERVPAPLQVARTQALRRQLHQTDWLLRRCEDGRYVATARRGAAPRPLSRVLASELRRRTGTPTPAQLRRALGIRSDSPSLANLPQHAEPAHLHWAGVDRYGRPLWLQVDAAHAWSCMRRTAAREGIQLDAISGFRSAAYQAGIFRRKLARGQTLDRILEINAAPGYSEHHSGRALDIGTPGEPAAELGFESSPAFAWLNRRASAFGFRLSYPRGNPTGIQYEPWHWCWHPAVAGAWVVPRGN